MTSKRIAIGLGFVFLILLFVACVIAVPKFQERRRREAEQREAVEYVRKLRRDLSDLPHFQR